MNGVAEACFSGLTLAAEGLGDPRPRVIGNRGHGSFRGPWRGRVGRCGIHGQHHGDLLLMPCLIRVILAFNACPMAGLTPEQIQRAGTHDFITIHGMFTGH